MATARQRADWLRTATAAAVIVNRNGFTKDPLDPIRLIPAPFRPAPEPAREKTAEEIELESQMAWALLDRAFGGKG